MKDNLIDLGARILMGLIFLLAGLNKIADYEGTQGYMEMFNVPGMLLPLVILVEVVGALSLILGIKARWGAIALAVFTILAGALFHFDLGDQNEVNHLLKNIAIVGGLLLVVLHGTRDWSLGRKLGWD